MGKVKKYKLYVFDLDGTLADTKDDLGRGFSEVVVSHGYKKPSEEEVIASVGRGIANAIGRLTGLKENVPAQYIDEFTEIYDRICCDNVKLYEGARELLIRLKKEGARLALITMKPKIPAWKIIKYLEIDIFGDVVTFEDTDKRKPDPDSLFKLLEKYGLQQCEALMVGDSSTDIQFAKAAGVDVCIMEYGYGNKEEMCALRPEYLLKSFSEF